MSIEKAICFNSCSLKLTGARREFAARSVFVGAGDYVFQVHVLNIVNDLQFRRSSINGLQYSIL